MDHAHQRLTAGSAPADPPSTSHGAESLNRIAVVATLHCLLGCAIGEVAGLLIGTALG